MKYDRKTVLLGFLIFFSVIFQILVLRSGFVSLSGDEFFRGLLSYEWHRTPYFASGAIGEAHHIVWLPFQFWVVGAALHAYFDLWFTPILVSMCFSTLTLIVLYKLTRLLFYRETIGYLAVLIASLTPWYVWLSITGMPYSMFHFFAVSGILGVLTWQHSKNDIYLLLSSIAFLMSTILRQEGWFFAFLFSGYLTYYLARYRRNISKTKTVIISMLIPHIFIGLWIVYDAISYGEFLHFVTFQDTYVQNQTGSAEALPFRIIRYPFLLFVVSPFISIVTTVIAISQGFRRRRTTTSGIFACNAGLAKLYFFFILGEFLFVVMMTVGGAQTNAAPQRYVVITLLLLTPLVSGWLFHIFSRKPVKKGVRRMPYVQVSIFILVGLILGFQVYTSFHYPNYYADPAAVGRVLKNLWKQEVLTQTDLVWTEKFVQDLLEIPNSTGLERLILASEHAGIQILSNHPANFSYIHENEKYIGKPFMPETTNLPVFSREEEKWTFFLAHLKPRVLVLKERASIERVPEDFQHIASVGEYRVFCAQLNQNFRLASPTVPKTMEPVYKHFDDTLMLVGYDLGRAAFPKYITLFWKLSEETPRDYKIFLDLIHKLNPTISYSKEFFLYDGIWKTSQWKAGDIVQDSVPLAFLSSDMVPGEYQIRVSIKGITPADPVVVGPIPVISSKTEVIKRFLKGEDVNLSLLIKVIATL